MRKSDVGSHKFLVLGAARSGIAAARLLKAHGADVVVADSKSREQATEAADRLDRAGIDTAWGDEATRAALMGRTVLVKSPGIPQNNPIVLMARDACVRVISEIELASAFVPDGARVIAITGTNGKTTVTAWLTHVLAECGFNAISAGNIGDAWAARLLDPPSDPAKTVYVVEVSSFQLENLEDFHPNVAVLTNITPDHMDRYDDDMAKYISAKANLLRNMTGDDVFVWNRADPESGAVARLSKARNLAFDASGAAAAEDTCAFVQDSAIWLAPCDRKLRAASAGNTAERVLAVGDLPLPGEHNLQNALAVILSAQAVDASTDAILAALKTFAGVEHRIELCVTRADGVQFYNDSKATNLDAMEKAVVAFDKPMVLIAGGRDAHSDYTSINDLIKAHVTHLITLGEAAPLIEAAWGEIVPTQHASSMAEAVEMANRVAVAGSVVVFSPACKSFDMYNNYEERGRDFKVQVRRVVG